MSITDKKCTIVLSMFHGLVYILSDDSYDLHYRYMHNHMLMTDERMLR